MLQWNVKSGFTLRVSYQEQPPARLGHTEVRCVENVLFELVAKLSESVLTRYSASPFVTASAELLVALARFSSTRRLRSSAPACLPTRSRSFGLRPLSPLLRLHPLGKLPVLTLLAGAPRLTLLVVLEAQATSRPAHVQP